RVIGKRLDAGVLQGLRQLLDLATRGTVDDAAFTLMALHEGQGLARRALLWLEGEPEIGPVEAAHEGARRVGEQLLDDVVPRRRVGRGSESHGLQSAADLARERPQGQILGSEVV